MARAIAAFGLSSRWSFPPQPLADVEFSELLSGLEDHRLLGLLAAAIRADAMPVTAAQHQLAAEALTKWLSHDLRVERVAQQCASELGARGIDVRVLKGVALAHTRYPDPSWRVFSDLDLLVPEESFSTAADHLQVRLGAGRVVPELRPGFDQAFGREITLRATLAEVDLHRTLVDGAYGHRVHLPDLFADPQEFALGDHVMLTLGSTAQFLHTCFSARLGDWPPRRMSQRDVAQLLLTGEIDLAEVTEIAERWKAQAVIATAVRAAWEELGLVDEHPVTSWAKGYRVPLLDRLLLRSYEGTARGYRSHLAGALVIPGVRRRVTYLGAILRPSKAYLEARGLTRGDRLRRLLGS